MKYIVFKRYGHKITILHPETASTFNIEIPRLMKKRISRKIIDTSSLHRNYLGPGYNKKIKKYTMEMLRGGSASGLMKLIRKLEIGLNYVYQS